MGIIVTPGHRYLGRGCAPECSPDHQALQRFGFAAANVQPGEFMDRTKVRSFGREPFRVDILASPSGIDFETCYARRIEADLDGIRVPFIAIEDLKVNKRASGRLKDLADVESLSSATAKPAASRRKTVSRKKRKRS
jgi:hypothetical protein